MTVLVTGGAGFIGRRLTRRLQEGGARVRVLDPVGSGAVGDEHVIGRVEDPDAVERATAGVDAVYHLAAEHRDDVRPTQRYYTVNVDGTGALLDACSRHGVRRFVFASTVALYGLNLDGATEDTPPEPFNDYGASKLQAEGLVEAWARADAHHRAAIVRPCVVIGPGNRGNVHNLFTQVRRLGPVVVGDGRNRKSMAYVENVADFLLFCGGLDETLVVFNYADKPDLETGALVLLASRALGRGERLVRIPLPVGLAVGRALDRLARLSGRTFALSEVRVQKFCSSSVVDSSRAFATGFTPRFTLTEGIRAMLDAASGAEDVSEGE